VKAPGDSDFPLEPFFSVLPDLLLLYKANIFPKPEGGEV